jgi:hypothetical protein
MWTSYYDNEKGMRRPALCSNTLLSLTHNRDNLINWRPIYQSTMRQYLIVFPPLLFNQPLHICKYKKYFSVKEIPPRFDWDKKLRFNEVVIGDFVIFEKLAIFSSHLFDFVRLQNVRSVV